MSDGETREYIIGELDKLSGMICGMWGCDPTYFIGSDDAEENHHAIRDTEAMHCIWYAIRALEDVEENEWVGE